MKNIDFAAMGRRILECRRAMGLTQAELAARVGVSLSFIGHLERAEKIPSLDTVASVCGALGVTMD